MSVKSKPILTKIQNGDGQTVTLIKVPSRSYRSLPKNLAKYAPPRLALVRSATPIAHIAHPKWGKSKIAKPNSSSN